MSEMIERVSNAMADHFKQIIEIASGGSFSESGVTLPGNHVWDGYAEAAIKAMREPTGLMFQEGRRVDIMALRNVTSIWQAMIDEALTP